MKNRIKMRYINTLIFSAWLMWSALGSAQGLPEGEGRDAMVAACTACHGLDNITDPYKKLSAVEWEMYLYDMVARGASVYEKDIEPIKEYLIQNFAVD
jgi:cytochrome c553